MANTLKFGAGQWATKEGSTLAYNDQNDNYKPLPFDFTRASSATVVNKSGLIETVGNGIPRIDFLGNTQGALLLEPQRSNIITNSNSSNLNFTLDNVSMTYNSTTSPDGENNGILLKQTGSNSSNSAYNFGLTTANGTYTYSIFIKANDSEKVRIYSSNGTTLTQDFNPQEMTEGVLSGNLNLDFKSYGNDWFRVSFTRTLSTAPYHRLSIYPDRNNTQKSVYIFGLQIESNASYPTSYIPTSGSTVTRVADACNNGANEQVINSSEGVLYAEIAALVDDGTTRTIALNSDTNNRIQLYFDTTLNALSLFYKAQGITQFYFYETLSDATDFNKIAFKWKANDFALWVNGIETDTVSNGVTPTNLGSLDFKMFNDSNPFYGNVKDLKLYNTALSDSELATLTTI